MGENSTKFIVYLTTNKVNQKIYIGVHKTQLSKFDGYLGNGIFVNKPSSYKFARTPFEMAVAKYGPDSFIRATIKEFETEQEALDLEKELVDLNFIKRKDTYNVTLGGGYPPNKKVEVHKYSLTGEYIESFESIKEASFATKGVKSINIARSAKDPKNAQAGGFLWSYDKVDRLETYELYNKPKRIGQYDLDGNLIKIYETVRECKKDFSGCVHVLKGTRKKAGGFTFNYID